MVGKLSLSFILMKNTPFDIFSMLKVISAQRLIPKTRIFLAVPWQRAIFVGSSFEDKFC